MYKYAVEAKEDCLFGQRSMLPHMWFPAWLRRWADRKLQAENDRLKAESGAISAELDARGCKTTMTDAEYGKLMRSAEAAGPEGMEQFIGEAGR